MRKPNVLFILADDQRYDTIHALGNKQIKTPNLDKLVAKGVAFSHAHIPGGTSGAVCMPSRAMIHSGRTLFHLYGNAGEEIPVEHITMGQCFKENGYQTIGIGKWHNGTESYQRSFTDGDNIFFGGMWDHWNVPVCNYHEDGIYNKIANFTPDFFHANHPMEMICDKLNVGVHSTDLFTDTALSFLEKKHDKPFFMYLSYLAPHDPRTMPEMEVKQHIADYYGMISHIDYNIGRLIDALEKSGELENTIIVFTGDNGLAIGRHGLMGKQNVYEHSIRVPLLMSGPGVQKGNIANNYVYLLDIYPTLCDVVGIEIPKSVEGLSFKPMLEGATDKTRNDLFFAYTNMIRGVKTEKYKLVEYRLERNCSQLFDLKNDPFEKVNLYHEPQYREIVQEMKALLQSYKSNWEDTTNHKYTKEFWDSVIL